MNYEQEEEYLTNDLSRKLHQVSVKDILFQCAGQDQIEINKFVKF